MKGYLVAPFIALGAALFFGALTVAGLVMIPIRCVGSLVRAVRR